jgi:hypothetical protein
MGMLTEAEVVAQLSAQHTQYTANPALVGSQVQTDHDARVTAANAAHTQVTNSTFTNLNTETVAPDRGVINAERYTGANVVAPVNATIMEADVRTALDADQLFTHGGPYTSDYSLASPYVDGLTLIQGSLLTGEKFF